MLTKESNDRYISILSDGKLHEAVPAGTDGAVLREYETSDGKKGEKWELVYQKIEAKIVGVEFHDGDYGKNIQVRFQDDDGNEVVLSQGTATNFGEDLMKKLPNVDFSEKVALVPYSFEDDNGKPRRGVNLYQKDKKLDNYFYDREAKKSINGYPEPSGDTEMYDKEDWKIHFLQARKFLVNYIEQNITPKLGGSTGPQISTAVEYPSDDEINPDDIPF